MITTMMMMMMTTTMCKIRRQFYCVIAGSVVVVVSIVDSYIIFIFLRILYVCIYSIVCSTMGQNNFYTYPRDTRVYLICYKKCKTSSDFSKSRISFGETFDPFKFVNIEKLVMQFFLIVYSTIFPTHCIVCVWANVSVVTTDCVYVYVCGFYLAINIGFPESFSPCCCVTCTCLTFKIMLPFVVCGLRRRQGRLKEQHTHTFTCILFICIFV